MRFVFFIKNNKYLMYAFIILICLSITRNIINNSAPQVATEERPIDLSTYIPKGYVLVPIEFNNIDILDALIQDYGIIDLYLTHEGSKNKIKIAERIKILRAPYNPNVFAVLVKEEFSETIAKQNGAFEGVIQNAFISEGGISPAQNKVFINRDIEVDYN